MNATESDDAEFRRLVRKDTIGVEIDGEHVDVCNWATATVRHRVRPVGGNETWTDDVLAGDGSAGEPDAITPWLADALRKAGVTVPDDVRVINPTDPEVAVL